MVGETRFFAKIIGGIRSRSPSPDRLVAFEDRLIGELDGLASVDGHDFGLGEFNIFILTDDPAESFDRAHRVVADQVVPNAMRSAYRQVDGEDYVILWPSSLKDFKVL